VHVVQSAAPLFELVLQQRWSGMLQLLALFFNFLFDVLTAADLFAPEPAEDDADTDGNQHMQCPARVPTAAAIFTLKKLLCVRWG
jgi:hypothetical protein